MAYNNRLLKGLFIAPVLISLIVFRTHASEAKNSQSVLEMSIESACKIAKLLWVDTLVDEVEKIRPDWVKKKQSDIEFKAIFAGLLQKYGKPKKVVPLYYEKVKKSNVVWVYFGENDSSAIYYAVATLYDRNENVLCKIGAGLMSEIKSV
jgi:hypothetical protein